MKQSILALVFVGFLTLVGCSTTDNAPAPKEDILSGSWEVQNISGGFAGINDDYEAGIITWTFTTPTSKLEIINNNDKAGIIYDGLVSGEYDYSILTVSNKQYLEINGQEFAGISISNGQLLLDQNQISTGTGADGFQLLFTP